MRNFLSIIGPVVSAVGFIPYLIQTARGTIRPRVASWATWTLVTGIGTIAALSERAYTSAFLTGVSTLIEISILVIALKKGDHDYGLLDGVCQAISMIGIFAWLLSKQAVWAILFNMLADFCGVIPTLYHSWVSPHDESWLPFALSGVGALISLSAVKNWGIVSGGFPLYLAVVGLLLGIVIYTRQKVLPKPDTA